MIIDCVICKNKSHFVFDKYDWGKKFDFYKCENCSHCFVWPLPSEQELNDFYNTEYYVPEFQKLKVFKKASDSFAFVDVNKKPMLEVGCSYGYFLNWMRDKGVIVEGVELSQKASQFASHNNHNVFNGQLKNLPSDKKFLTIFMFDVLEHLPNLEEVLVELKTRTCIGGELILTVPNQGSLEFLLFGKYWEWVSPPAHIHYFNHKSISQLLNDHNFQVSTIISLRGDSAGNLFFHFADALKRCLLFRLGTLIYGKEKFLEKKKAYNLQKKAERQNAQSEFSGTMKWVQIISKLFNPIDYIIRSKKNQATLLVKAVRI